MPMGYGSGRPPTTLMSGGSRETARARADPDVDKPEARRPPLVDTGDVGCEHVREPIGAREDSPLIVTNLL